MGPFTPQPINRNNKLEKIKAFNKTMLHIISNKIHNVNLISIYKFLP